MSGTLHMFSFNFILHVPILENFTPAKGQRAAGRRNKVAQPCHHSIILPQSTFVQIGRGRGVEGPLPWGLGTNISIIIGACNSWGSTEPAYPSARPSSPIWEFFQIICSQKGESMTLALTPRFQKFLWGRKHIIPQATGLGTSRGLHFGPDACRV